MCKLIQGTYMSTPIKGTYMSNLTEGATAKHGQDETPIISLDNLVPPNC